MLLCTKYCSYIKLGVLNMYNDGQVLGAATTTGGVVAALPLTSGNSVFHSILLATAAVAVVVLIVRIIKLSSERNTL